MFRANLILKLRSLFGIDRIIGTKQRVEIAMLPGSNNTIPRVPGQPTRE